MSLEYTSPTEALDSDTKAVLIYSGDHREMVDMCVFQATKKVVLTSNRVGNVAESQGYAPLSACNDSVDVFVYEQKLNPKSQVDAAKMRSLEKEYSGIEFRRVKKAHAKLLCWDHDHAVITSLNWLSKADSSDQPLSEIGVYIQHPGISEFIIEKIEAHYGANKF